jgi:hypothetical protein
MQRYDHYHVVWYEDSRQMKDLLPDSDHQQGERAKKQEQPVLHDAEDRALKQKFCFMFLLQNRTVNG